MRPLAVTRKSVNAAQVHKALETLVYAISQVSEVKSVFLFGSATSGKMTDQSDIDLLLVVERPAEIRSAQKQLRNIQRLTNFAVDLVWVDLIEFERKKVLGGVCLIAFEDGRCLFSRESDGVI